MQQCAFSVSDAYRVRSCRRRHPPPSLYFFLFFRDCVDGWLRLFMFNLRERERKKNKRIRWTKLKGLLLYTKDKIGGHILIDRVPAGQVDIVHSMDSSSYHMYLIKFLTSYRARRVSPRDRQTLLRVKRKREVERKFMMKLHIFFSFSERIKFFSECSIAPVILLDIFSQSARLVILGPTSPVRFV